MSVNSLGPFEFVAFHVPSDRGAPPIIPAMDGDLVQRAGVDGSSSMRLGVKAQPFQMRSIVDVVGMQAATDLMADYLSHQNADPLDLIWGGIAYETSYQTNYLVLRVEPIRIRRVSGMVGGMNGSSGTHIVEALWTLLPLKVA